MKIISTTPVNDTKTKIIFYFRPKNSFFLYSDYEKD